MRRAMSAKLVIAAAPPTRHPDFQALTTITPSASRNVLRSASAGTIAVTRTAAAAAAIAPAYDARVAPTTARVTMPSSGRGAVRSGIVRDYDKPARRRKPLYTSPPHAAAVDSRSVRSRTHRADPRVDRAAVPGRHLSTARTQLARTAKPDRPGD